MTQRLWNIIQREFDISELEHKLQLFFDTNIQRWLLLSESVSNQTCDQIDEEVHRTAMTRVLNLRDILQLIVDRFNDGSLPEHDLIEHRQQLVLHRGL